MPSPKTHRRGQTDQNNRKGKLGEKASSFHENFPGTMSGQLRRPKTVPDLPSYWTLAGKLPEGLPRQPPKLLLNVTMLGSLGAVHVVMTPESTFSLESLDREEKLMELGSRNFFLCPKKCKVEDGGGGNLTTPFDSCCKQADKASKAAFVWPKFMEFLL
ncbi:hypothetical protein O6P43_000421 [Quillaja saponaria]|uniref:DUF7054 domain-containing protein n=1 Tax=Quillaja saponaria TaxID=32244 RepID=A0AAD7VM57_QUISA|nr:hypothetical protein O6P43_000421 [Quillaja saponaria]